MWLVQMKKYFFIGCSILCLLFFVLFLTINIASAQTPAPTITPTETSSLVPMFQTPTPPAPGQCPDQPVNPNLDLTYKYKELCEHCLMTPTVSFKTSTPIPEATATLLPGTGTSTPTNTATVTPTATPTQPFKVVTMTYRYKGVAKSNLLPDTDYRVNLFTANLTLGVPQYAVGDWFDYSFELSPISSIAQEGAKSFTYTTGYSYINEIWHPIQYIGLITSVDAYVTNLTNKRVEVTWNMGHCSGQTVVLTSQNAFTKCSIFYGYNMNPASINDSTMVDVKSETSGLGAKDYTVRFAYADRVQPGANGNLTIAYKNGGIFYIPPNPGYCTVPKLKEPDETPINTIIPMWVGEEHCIDLGFVINWVNNPVVRTIISTFSAQNVPDIGDLPLEVCIRQFYVPSFMFFGINIDISYFLYAIASIWAIKSVLGLITAG
jgi:hypothetical protein